MISVIAREFCGNAVVPEKVMLIVSEALAMGLPARSKPCNTRALVPDSKGRRRVQFDTDVQVGVKSVPLTRMVKTSIPPTPASVIKSALVLKSFPLLLVMENGEATAASCEAT